jgi:hypothetical protein
MAKVSQRKAPGAISAIALLVRLVKLRVVFIWPGGVVAICVPS